jgi:predicted nucleic-acid-binding Zn-ribbon protein
MKKGVCLKCGSRNVYSAEQGVFTRTHHGVPITAWTTASLTYYVCVDCGYVEHYIADPSSLTKITQKWNKVGA